MYLARRSPRSISASCSFSASLASDAPLLLGFILAPLCELHFRRSLILSRGDLGIFLERPISAAFVGLTIAILLLLIMRAVLRRGGAS